MREKHLEQYEALKAPNSKYSVADAPSEKVCRDTLSLLPDNAADTLRAVNKELLAMQAKSEGVALS